MAADYSMEDGGGPSPLCDWGLVASNISQLCQPPNGTEIGHQDDQDGYLSSNLKITLIVLLSLMIVCTVIGNILVCLSVILVRKLRHPSNYLLVSLAISDLCVAILVMPLALQSELSQTWRLSNAICDLWVSFDVTCCTSSILNLCTISIDRYLAITRPLTYGVRRTTKRMLSFIVAVWLASILISIPPVLILGNEHGTDEQPRCEVSQNLGYQLYATLGAFYIPLLVMIVMYYKIYVAAKRVVDAELRDQRPSCHPSAHDRKSSCRRSTVSLSSGRLDKNQNCLPDPLSSPELKRKPKKKRKRKRGCCGCRSSAARSQSPQHPMTAATMVNSDGGSVVVTTTTSATGANREQHRHQNGHHKPVSSLIEPSTSVQATESLHIRKHRKSSTVQHDQIGGGQGSVLSSKQRASNALRERKASVTLGIIMTAFTVCWLPFFILAVLRPFSASVMQIPHYVNSIALWLGYANSMLNPIIYVTFHQDFRRAFKYLLCLQCRSMGSRLRAEAYQSQYGAKSKYSPTVPSRTGNRSLLQPSFEESSPTAPGPAVRLRRRSLATADPAPPEAEPLTGSAAESTAPAIQRWPCGGTMVTTTTTTTSARMDGGQRTRRGRCSPSASSSSADSYLITITLPEPCSGGGAVAVVSAKAADVSQAHTSENSC